jgi:hypothetical protein
LGKQETQETTRRREGGKRQSRKTQDRNKNNPRVLANEKPQEKEERVSLTQEKNPQRKPHRRKVQWKR